MLSNMENSTRVIPTSYLRYSVNCKIINYWFLTLMPRSTCACVLMFWKYLPLLFCFVFFFYEGRGAGERDLLSGDVLIVICMYS